MGDALEQKLKNKLEILARQITIVGLSLLPIDTPFRSPLGEVSIKYELDQYTLKVPKSPTDCQLTDKVLLYGSKGFLDVFLTAFWEYKHDPKMTQHLVSVIKQIEALLEHIAKTHAFIVPDIKVKSVSNNTAEQILNDFLGE